MRMAEWDKFLKTLESATKDIDEPFFRGHADVNWPLVPSLGRRRFHRNFENNIYYDFLTYGTPWLPPNVDSWDTLFVMRHHGLPTRLLDWTQSFSVAVYFALASWSDNAAVWVMDPYELNHRTIRDESIWHPQTDFDHDYRNYFIDDPKKKFPGAAIAILPNKTSPRVLGQRAVFTIHRSQDQPLDLVCKSALTKVVLPKRALDGAKDFLKLAGVNEFTLFPDLDGLAHWLQAEHQVEIAKVRTTFRRSRRKQH